MLENTITGISRALYDAFGEEYERYVDKVTQDLNEPCFLIIPLNQGREQKLGRRYELSQSFDVHYFPKSEDNTLECAGVLERLYDVLEYITVSGDLVRGTDMRGEIVNGVLHFFVDYNVFLWRPEEKAAMEEADISVMERMKRDG